MTRPLSPLVFVAIFLFIVIAAVLMFAVVLGQQNAPPASTPRMAIALQLELLREGDAVGLRLTVTERLRGQLTDDVVAGARPRLADATVDTLVGATEEVEDARTGTQRVLVRTPGGRLLTTLVLVDGEWQADSLWFR